ncbi:MAG: metal ABC transporter ATP-binding protein [Thermoactinomyces sp.]
MNDPVVEIKNLSYTYDEQKVLDEISLTVNKGEFLGIVGPNGSGKSTLIKCMLGILKPQQGSISIFGSPIRKLPDRSRIGYVSQKANSFNSGFPATVKEVVASGLYGKLGLFRRMGKKHMEQVERAIAQVDLLPYMNRNIGKLSGGQQQRAFIARALVAAPELLVLDEPTVGIDARTTEQFYELLGHLHREQGLTMIMVTHDIGAVSSVVDRVACLNRHLYYYGDPAGFKEKQQEILTRAYGHDLQVVSHYH